MCDVISTKKVKQVVIGFVNWSQRMNVHCQTGPLPARIPWLSIEKHTEK